MSRYFRRFLPAFLSLLFILAASASFDAQENSYAHPMRFAQLTYGEGINAMAADGAGGVWFGGYTCSTTLPTTPNAVQRTWAGQPCLNIGLLGRMKADGTLAYLSYFGGTGNTRITALAVGPGGTLYVAGLTASADFPTTTGAYARFCRNCSPNVNDGFVTELSADGSQIVFSTYLGGSANDSVLSIAVDAGGRVDVAGMTSSPDFPTTPGAMQPSFAGSQPSDSDAFYARLSADGASLQYATYLGGSGYDEARGLAVDAAGDAYIDGVTFSADFPTVNAVDTNGSSNGQPAAFLARFGSSGPAYVTYVGGRSGSAYAVAVVGDRAYVGGWTSWAGAYVAELAAANGAVLRTAGLHGTIATTSAGMALAVDQNHVAYLAGWFGGNDCTSCGPETGRYPATWDAYKRSLSGSDQDAVLSIVDFSGSAPVPDVRYSTMLGGALSDSASAVALDGAGGAFIGGASTAGGGFDSIHQQSQPAPDAGASNQSFVAYVGRAPVTLPAPPADIVLYAADLNGISPSAIGGNWKIDGDSTAAAGYVLHQQDGGAVKITSPSASPANDFELEFQAQANVPYHLWLRMKADNNSYQNDSVWAQFSDSVDAGGNPIWRTNSTDGTAVSLEDCSGCGEQGWGWNDNGYGVPGTPVYFATTGWHTIRIQQREDGVAIDQIVLSSAQWFNAAPGANKNDATILPETREGATDQPPVVSITSPANGATFAAGPTIDITASASDPDGTVSKVDFYANGAHLGSSDTSAPYTAALVSAPPGTYALTAVATDNQGVSTTSATVTITIVDTSAGLPAGWRDFDVGNTGALGSATWANGVFTVNGAGADVWGTSDAFNFAETELSGNGSIVARVASVSDQASWVKAGVMIRAGLGDSAAHAFMLVSHAKGVAFQRRTVDGGTTVSTPGSASTAPRWVRLDRIGNTIYAYESPDDWHWTLVGSDTFSMPTSVFVGLAVSSHVTGTLATATFDGVTTALPPTWGDADIGSVPFPGGALWNASTFQVTGSGADIWGTADAFNYAYTLMNGNGTIVARVATVQDVAPWVKAGVMIRNSFDPGSPQASVFVSAERGVAFQRRDTAGGTSVSTAGSASAAPRWVKLTRSGDLFTAYESADGTAWTLIGSDTIPMAQSIYIGLAVTSHSTSASATCTFDHVSIQ